MKKVWLFLIFLLCNYVGLFPSVSRLMRWKGIEELSKAKVKNVMIDYKGFVSLSPNVDTLFQSTEIFLWDCVSDSKGNLYVSSGNEGKVFKITPTHQVSTVFSSKRGAEIYALAVDEKDNIYIGESPSGIIYRLSKNEKVKVFFKTGEKYIWKMVLNRTGMLFAATGARGKLFKISPEGKGETYYISKDNHIVSLIMYQNRMYAGTEPNGLLIEVVRKNKAIVLYDTEENEVHSLVGIDDKIFFATVSRPTAIAPSSYTSFFSGVNPTQGTKVKEKSKLYKFDIEKKTITLLWECPTPPIYSMSGFKNGEILLGTEKGKLYAADKDGRISQMNQFEESPILNIVKDRKKNSYFILTGNLGKAFRMGPELSKVGSIISDVFDTGRKSGFGKVNWDVNIPKGTSFSLWLRVGNKKNPDEDWSDWKRMKEGGEIKLPSSRFIQIKCKLRGESKGQSPLLREVSISFLSVNRPPVIKEVIVCPVGISADQGIESFLSAKTPISERQKNFYKNLGYELPKTVYYLKKGKRCVYWKAIDPDGDSLNFSIFYRGEEEKEWKELKKGLKKSAFIWDETTLPDGIYYVKVSASDERDNPAFRALNAEFVSEPFVIDNTPPVIEVNSVKVKGKDIAVKVTAKDRLSTLKFASYSVNAGEWNVILPRDGIFDSKEEEFYFTIKTKEKGEKTVVVKVTDFSLNTETGKGTVEVE